MLNFAEVYKISDTLSLSAMKAKQTPENKASISMMNSDVLKLKDLKNMCAIAYKNNLFYEENGYTEEYAEECISSTISYINSVIKYCEGYQQALEDMKEGKKK